jgi:hypothetical protein
MKKNDRQRAVVIFALWLGIVLISSGCEPLRKKFTRHKKGDQAREVMPVLEPIDYPAPKDDPAQRYRQAYGLWKVWHSELLSKFDGEIDNEKNIRSLFDQDLRQLAKMNDLLAADRQNALKPVVSEIRSALADFNEPESMRNMTVIRRKMRTTDKTVREQFSPKDIFKETP